MEDKVDWAVRLALISPVLLGLGLIVIGIIRKSFIADLAGGPDGVVDKAMTPEGELVINKADGRYTISVAGIERHSGLSPDAALVTLLTYLHGSESNLFDGALRSPS